MTLGEKAKTVQLFRELWNRLPKGVPVRAKNETGENEVGILFEIRDFQVAVFVCIGPKFVLHEYLVVVDTREKDMEDKHLYVSTITKYVLFSCNLLQLTMPVQSALFRKNEDEILMELELFLIGQMDAFVNDNSMFLRRVLALVSEDGMDDLMDAVKHIPVTS